MRIKMRTTAASPAGVWIAGRIYDLPESTVKQLVAGGYAELLSVSKQPKKTIETATMEPPENTAMPKPKRRKKGK